MRLMRHLPHEIGNAPQLRSPLRSWLVADADACRRCRCRLCEQLALLASPPEGSWWESLEKPMPADILFFLFFLFLLR